MNADIAHSIARQVHVGQLSRSRKPIIEHVERVANSVPEEARALAYLHDVLERSDTTAAELSRRGLTATEYAALELLTRDPSDSYEAYVMRIAEAPGRAGSLARLIKLADLEDHLRFKPRAKAPDYAWAHEQVRGAQKRRRTLASGTTLRRGKVAQGATRGKRRRPATSPAVQA